jgi:hypothetical protein
MSDLTIDGYLNPPPYRLMAKNFKEGDLFQLTKFRERTEEINIEYTMRKFTDFYCEIIEVSRMSITIQVYSVQEDKPLLYANKDGTHACATLSADEDTDVWYIPYSKIDLSRINILEIDEDALIPEEMYK